VDNLQNKVDNSFLLIYHYRFAFILAALRKERYLPAFPGCGLMLAGIN